jgi:hypothetical protein
VQVAGLRGCPFEEGFTLHAKEEPVTFDISYMPISYAGRWRVTVFADFHDGYDCYHLYADVHNF